MYNDKSVFKIKNLLLSILGILLFFLVGSLNAYNNQWSDNEDYVVPSETNVTPGEGNNSQEVKGAKDCPKKTASPVYAATGHFTWSARDILLHGKPPIQFSRSYTSKDPISGLFGNGWISNLESGFIETTKHINDDGSLETHYVYRREDGMRYTFKDVNGIIEAPSGMYHTIESISDTSYKVTYPDHMVETYSDDTLISKEDANGNTISYIYDENSLIQEIKNHNGNTLSFTFGANGYVTAITDNNHRVWKYTYDVNGNLTSVTNPLGGVRNYTYERYQADNDAQVYFHLTKITDETGVVITEVTYEKGNSSYYEYKNGRVKSYMEGENNNTYDWRYINNSNPYVVKTDASGWDRLYLSASGHVVKYYDSSSKTTTFNIDENMTMTGFTDRGGNEWKQSVDDFGRIVSSTSPLGFETTYKYNGKTRDISQTTSPKGYITKIGYDSNYNPTRVTLADNSVYKASFDAKGNVLDTTDPSGVKNSTTTYNANSQPLTIKNALNDTFTITYNSFAQTATTTDGEGNIVTYTYNALGYLTKTVNSLNGEVAYTYDKAGRLLTMKDPTKTNTTTYKYDTFGRVSKVLRADGRTLEYAYDPANRIRSIIDSAGRTTSFTYDSAGHITKVMAGTSSINYYYNADGSMYRAYNGKNVYLTYNADGQLTRERQDNQNVDYTYNDNGKVKTMVAKGTTITYSRNNIGDLESISDGTDTVGFTYDTNNLRSTIIYPNNLDIAYTLNNAYQITALDNGLTQNAYIYDSNGMVTKKTVDSAITSYTYDSLGRVRVAGADSYSYSLVGNILNNGATYDTQTNQLSATNDYTYEYDAFGNLSKKINMSDNSYKVYTWTDWNQLASVESFGSFNNNTKKISFTYGPLGRRLSKTVDGVTQTFLYNNNNLIAIMGNDYYKTLQYTIIHDEVIDSPLVIVSVSGDRYYYHRDYLGSVVGLTDSSGTMVERYSYDTYGVTTQNSLTATTGNPFGFTSRVMDDDDLYYYRSRYYDPTVGRFLSEDSQGFSSGDFNLYRYGLNNPVNFIDPYGFKPGDKFASAADAVKDAFAYINPSSISESREYGGWIHKDAEGKYSYSEPTRGTLDGLANMPDSVATDVAWYHTHGSADPGYDNENFSGADGDKGYSDALNKVGWLATPAGAIKKYDPATSTVSNEGNVSNDPCKAKKR